jgi:hypothetical protein
MRRKERSIFFMRDGFIGLRRAISAPGVIGMLREPRRAPQSGHSAKERGQRSGDSER